jgi:hypothetical protein
MVDSLDAPSIPTAKQPRKSEANRRTLKRGMRIEYGPLHKPWAALRSAKSSA